MRRGRKKRRGRIEEHPYVCSALAHLRLRAQHHAPRYQSADGIRANNSGGHQRTLSAPTFPLSLPLCTCLSVCVMIPSQDSPSSSLHASH